MMDSQIPESEAQSNVLIDATRAQFIARSSEALARFALYTQKPIGVGGHSNIVEETVRAIEDYEQAQSCVAAIDSLFNSSQ